jgi:hypothetical protein
MKQVILDFETYPNLLLVGYFDLTEKTYRALTEKNMAWLERDIRRHHPDFVTFNGKAFDLRLLQYCLARFRTSPDLAKEIHLFASYIINGKDAVSPQQAAVFDLFRWWPHRNLDLRSLLGHTCPSLKKLAVRLNLPQVEALPIPPNTWLTEEQKQHIVAYNKQDVINTKHLLDYCGPQLALREEMSRIFNVDCRSLGDAPMAEKILAGNLSKPPKLSKSFSKPFTDFIAPFLFQTPQLQRFYERVTRLSVRFEESFSPTKNKSAHKKLFEEDEVRLTAIPINDIVPPVDFKFGGLHSVHPKRKGAVRGQQAWEIDVASYYPNLILRYNIYPANVGEKFLEHYRAILERRLAAKKAGRKTEADGLKITLNGVGGKFNEPYSNMYDPVCSASMCLHGELGLLRLMDLCFQHYVQIVSVNTDGIVVLQDPAAVIVAWEAEMKMTLECREIEKFVVKDSNNMLLRFVDGTVKAKGAAFNYISEPTKKQTNFAIVPRAVSAFLLDDVPLIDTIAGCRKLAEFIGVYSKGDKIVGLRSGEIAPPVGLPLPDLVRYYVGGGKEWIYKLGKPTPKQPVRSWTKVANSQGFVNVNTLPATFPADLNHAAYVRMAQKVLTLLF